MKIENIKKHLVDLGCDVVDLWVDNMGYCLVVRNVDNEQEVYYYGNYYEMFSHAVYLRKWF